MPTNGLPLRADGIPVNLRRALPRLDERNISLVIKAILRTSGQ